MKRSLTILLLLTAAACSAAEQPERSVSVSGNGTATAVPDGAIVQMAISARAKELGEAQARAAGVTRSVLALTDDLGIGRDNVDSTGASVRPDYRWNRDREEQELRGYIAERRMTVRVSELDKLGRLIEGAVGAGVNQVSPPQLTSSNKNAAYREALKQAARDARANAEVLASTLDAKLGDAMVISAGQQFAPPPQPQRVMAMDVGSEAAETYNPGDLEFDATVNVTFALTD